MTKIKMDIVNVNWGTDGLTIVLEDRNRTDADSKPFTSAEVMALVAKVEAFSEQEFELADEPVQTTRKARKAAEKPKDTQEELIRQLGTEKAVIDDRQLEIPILVSEKTAAIVYDINAKVEEAVASTRKDVEASGITPAQAALNTILAQSKPAEEIAKDLHDASALRAMAARESQINTDIHEKWGGAFQKLADSDNKPEPVKDTGQPLDELAREIKAEVDPEGTAEDDMALDVFTDEVEAITDGHAALDAAINVWTENKELFVKYPMIRDRARTILSAHVGKVLGVTASAASDMIKERLTGNARPAVQKPAEQINSAAAAFLERLHKDPKPVMGTAIKFACETVANPQKEVTAKLVEDFLVSLVGKHPALTSAQEIRDLVSSNRFKLFAAAAKTKVIE